jgi:O-antigen ligase
MKGIQEAHNGYLEIYLNLGWVGITLLSLLLMAGYRNVIAMFGRDRQAGRIRLAFFVVAVVYSFTEAGFKMLTPVWICFLLAVTAVPIADIPERPQLTGIDHMEIFSEVAR